MQILCSPSRVALFTGHWHGAKSRVASDSRLSDPSFATLRAGLRSASAGHHKSLCPSKNCFFLCKIEFCREFKMFRGALDHKEAMINQHNVGWLSDRRRVVRWTAGCARRHRIIILATGGCRGLGTRGEGEPGTFSLHRPVPYNATRNAASCCNGKNKTFTLPLKHTDHNWQSWDEISPH